MPPSNARLILASVVAVVVALSINALLVKLVTTSNHAISGFSHFRLPDYGTLTVLGVIAAAVAWTIATRSADEPRRLFLQLAVIATPILWIPDLWLLMGRVNTEAVATLMGMHLTVAICAYNLLVRVAPVRFETQAARESEEDQPVPAGGGEPIAVWESSNRDERPIVSRNAWIVMLTGVCAEFFVGVATLVFVPFGRANTDLPSKGETIYLIHAALGGLLVVGALGVLAGSLHDGRIPRIGGLIGLIGMTIGAIGGAISVDHGLRVAGVALMLVGTTAAFFGYLTPIIETPTEAAQATQVAGDTPTSA